jgi:hypothetical protein
MIKRCVTEFSESYTLNGKYHRPNGPAHLWSSGYGEWWVWFLHEKKHRYYGPQCINGDWYLHHERVK